MAAVSRVHGQTLKITKAASRIFAKQLYNEFSRLGSIWIRGAQRFSEHPQQLEDLSQDILGPHGLKIKDIITKNDVRVMRAIHTFQMEQLGVKSSDPLYAKTRGIIPGLARSLASTASGEMLGTTQKVLERGTDMVAEDAEPDEPEVPLLPEVPDLPRS